MAYETVFHLISDVLGKTKIPYVLIGGFAVNHYKFSRPTGDIDFLMSEQDFDDVLPLLEEAGCVLACRTSLFATLQAAIQPFMEIDILFVDRRTAEVIFRAGHTAEIAGQKLTVPSLEHLIALKLHALKNNPVHREGRDLRDILQLIKQNSFDSKSEQFHELCLTYGNEKIYQEIKQLLP